MHLVADYISEANHSYGCVVCDVQPILENDSQLGRAYLVVVPSMDGKERVAALVRPSSQSYVPAVGDSVVISKNGDSAVFSVVRA